MTEKDLVNYSFIKTLVKNADSSNGYDYYYYTLDLCDGISLISSESDKVKDNDWRVTSFEIPAMSIKTVEHMNAFIDLVKILIIC